MEATIPFPADWGVPESQVGMVAWDIVVEMEDTFAALPGVVEAERAKLPLAPPGFVWQIVNNSDEPAYDKSTKKLTLHFGAVKEAS